MRLFHKVLFSAFILVAGGTLAVAAGHDSHNAVKIGKGATIDIISTTQIGDLVLKPGTYSVKYKSDGDQHSMAIALIRDDATPPWSSASTYKPVGEVKCHTEAVAQKNPQTLLYSDNSSGATRITKLEVRGETVAHLF